MQDKEYAELVNKFIEQVLPQAGKLVLDIGLVNDLCIETRKRMTETSSEREAAGFLEMAEELLTENGIPFSRPGPYHYVVEGSRGMVDLWPSTLKWKPRSKGASQGYGLRDLIEKIKNRVV